MEHLGRVLIFIGITTLLLGIIFLLGGRFNIGRLPGDIIIRRENFTFYFPVVTGIVLSILLSLIFAIFNRVR